MSRVGRFRKILNESVKVANSYGIDITSELVLSCWSEPHRHWHTPEHLYEMLEGVEELYHEKKIDEREYKILIIAAVFHDIVYDTRRHDNEEKSVEFMMSKCDPSKIDHKVVSEWIAIEDLKKVSDVIMGTKTHDSKDGLLKKFNKLDSLILDAQFVDMMDWEKKIYKEYKWAGWKLYKKARIDFLLNSLKSHSYNAINIKNLIDYLNNKILKTGICYYEIDKLPSIEDMIEKDKLISNLFDEVITIIAYSFDDKEDLKEKREIMKPYILNSVSDKLHIITFDNLIDYIKRIHNLTVIKELKYKDEYNKEIEDELMNFRTIYV